MKPEVIDSLTESSGERYSILPGLSFELPPSKFSPPAARRGVVTRTTLVERLTAAQAPFITVVAPPGYGKTTLLAQWAERLGPRVAWVSCDDADNDPVVLFSALAMALDRIESVDPTIFWTLASSGAGITAAPRLVSAAAALQLPVTLVLDHAEAVTNKRCLDNITELALRLPLGWRLAVASRSTVPLPTARLRAQGRIVEITAADLAMGPAEHPRSCRARAWNPARWAYPSSCSGPRAGRPGCISRRWP